MNPKLFDSSKLRDLVSDVSRAQDAMERYQKALGLDHLTALDRVLNTGSLDRILDTRALDRIRDSGLLIAADVARQTDRLSLLGISSAIADLPRHGLALQTQALGPTLHLGGISRAADLTYSHTFIDLSRAVEEFALGFAPLLKGLPSAAPGLTGALKSFERAAWEQESWVRRLAYSIPSFPELDRLQGVLDDYENQILRAPDEETRRQQLTALLRAAVEGVVGFDLSPEKRLKLFFQVLRFLFTLLIWIRSTQQAQLGHVKYAETRRVQQEQGQTLTALAETMRQLQLPDGLDQIWYAEAEGSWFFDFTPAITNGTDELG